MAQTIPPNGATIEGTHALQKRLKNISPDKFRSFEGLKVSALGLGTYLGSYDDATDSQYADAITNAVMHGCNFFDAAINYRCQRSERILGNTLNKLFHAKKIHRSQIVVATKGGFIPFDKEPPANLADYIQQTFVQSGLVTEKDIVQNCHCLHPAYLQNQIDKSLKNLGLDTIDIYYLHNPEMQLSQVGADEFYDRLEKAFGVLEQNVALGKIQYYGLATWTAFREPHGHAELVNLGRVVDIATKVGGAGHHFKALQLPYSMAMLEAVSIHNQQCGEQRLPIISAAAHFGLGVMISAPLLQGQLLNLSPKLLQKIPQPPTVAQKALQFVASTPAVTSVMAGMKNPSHVAENLEVLKLENWDLATLEKVCEILTA